MDWFAQPQTCIWSSLILVKVVLVCRLLRWTAEQKIRRIASWWKRVCKLWETLELRPSSFIKLWVDDIDEDIAQDILCLRETIHTATVFSHQMCMFKLFLIYYMVTFIRVFCISSKSNITYTITIGLHKQSLIVFNEWSERCLTF